MDASTERLPGVTLTIVGAADPGHADYATNIADKIARAGFEYSFCRRSRRRAPLLQALRVFVMLSDDQGCPNASLEAMAAGLPVVANESGGAASRSSMESTAFSFPGKPARNRQRHRGRFCSIRRCGDPSGRPRAGTSNAHSRWNAWLQATCEAFGYETRENDNGRRQRPACGWRHVIEGDVKIRISLPEDRDHAGTLEVFDADGDVILGPFPAAGRAHDRLRRRTATHHAIRFCRMATRPPAHAVRGVVESGSGPAVVLEPVSGQAALADANGRFRLFIQGGGDDGSLPATTGAVKIRIAISGNSSGCYATFPSPSFAKSRPPRSAAKRST